MRKIFDFDTVQVGEMLGGKALLISDELIRVCENAIGSTHPWYLVDSFFGGQIAPPSIFDNASLMTLLRRDEDDHAAQPMERRHA